VIICAALMGAGAGCADSPERLAIVSSQPIAMRMRRTCQTCPNYVITLTGDGVVTYEGTDRARVQGVHTTRIDARLASDLLVDFLQSEFTELESVYPSPGDNRMTVTLSVEMNGFAKAVLSEDRYGPATLLELERKMDDLPGMRALSGWTH
jgi:hypothetical protein